MVMMIMMPECGIKLCVLVLIGLHNLAPSYLFTTCQLVTEDMIAATGTFSQLCGDLVVPVTRTICCGSHGFAVIGLSVWTSACCCYTAATFHPYSA